LRFQHKFTDLLDASLNCRTHYKLDLKSKASFPQWQKANVAKKWRKSN
jgi:hypothetical protein